MPIRGLLWDNEPWCGPSFAALVRCRVPRTRLVKVGQRQRRGGHKDAGQAQLHARAAHTPEPAASFVRSQQIQHTAKIRLLVLQSGRAAPAFVCLCAK